jgi:hypothetical protein
MIETSTERPIFRTRAVQLCLSMSVVLHPSLFLLFLTLKATLIHLILHIAEIMSFAHNICSNKAAPPLKTLSLECLLELIDKQTHS